MFSDKKAWGYAIVLLAMAIGGAALLMKIITWEQFKDVGAIATVLLALTATLRSTAAATEARVVKAVGKPCLIVDCFCILDDARIKRYLELGCEVKGMGRGHIRRIKESIRRR